MRTLAAATFVALGWIVPAAAGTLVPVAPVQGSNWVEIFGINNDNVIVGTYADANGHDHGFTGTIAGSYTTFDYGHGTGGTEARSISDDGYISGYVTSDGFHYLYEYLRKPNGKYDIVKNDGVPLAGVAQGITHGHTSVGEYWDDPYFTTAHGYVAKNGKMVASVDLPFETSQTKPRGINKSHVIAGYFLNSNGENEGFIQQNGVTQVIAYPDPSAINTYVEGLNDKGVVVGSWDDGSSTYGFRLDTRTGTFTEIKVAGARYVQIWAINDAGFATVDTDVGEFIYCPKKAQCGTGTSAVEVVRHVKAGAFLNYTAPTKSPVVGTSITAKLRM
ncbi:MAG TPA: hypothetical protein VGM17_17620 [Rhizomicrobium sp.]|jgi:hypothetical protein